MIAVAAIAGMDAYQFFSGAVKQIIGEHQNVLLIWQKVNGFGREKPVCAMRSR
jgi:hypothetical protein